MQKVILHSGKYRGNELNDVECNMMSPIKMGQRGLFAHFDVPGIENIRVQLPTETSVTILDEVKLHKNKKEEETEEDIIRRLRQ